MLRTCYVQQLTSSCQSLATNDNVYNDLVASKVWETMIYVLYRLSDEASEMWPDRWEPVRTRTMLDTINEPMTNNATQTVISESDGCFNMTRPRYYCWRVDSKMVLNSKPRMRPECPWPDYDWVCCLEADSTKWYNEMNGEWTRDATEPLDDLSGLVGDEPLTFDATSTKLKKWIDDPLHSLCIWAISICSSVWWVLRVSRPGGQIQCVELVFCVLACNWTWIRSKASMLQRWRWQSPKTRRVSTFCYVLAQGDWINVIVTAVEPSVRYTLV
jgi:hypothetical protein